MTETKEMPEQVKAEMSKILGKYGIADQSEQGRTCIDIGEMLKGIASRMKPGGNNKYLSKQLMSRTISILEKRGIKDPVARAECSLEIVKFVLTLMKAAGEK